MFLKKSNNERWRFTVLTTRILLLAATAIHTTSLPTKAKIQKQTCVEFQLGTQKHSSFYNSKSKSVSEKRGAGSLSRNRISRKILSRKSFIPKVNIPKDDILKGDIQKDDIPKSHILKMIYPENDLSWKWFILKIIYLERLSP